MKKKRAKQAEVTTYTYHAKLSPEQAKCFYTGFGPYWFLTFKSKNGTQCMTPVMYNTEEEAKIRAKHTEKALGVEVCVFQGVVRECGPVQVALKLTESPSKKKKR